jgi:hypothetical protein
MNDEAKLANLDHVPREQLRPEFVKVRCAIQSQKVVPPIKGVDQV